MRNLTARILLIVLILCLVALACVGGGEGNNSGSDTPGAGEAQGKVNNPTIDATATYGAEQLHIQLTAIAQPGP